MWALNERVLNERVRKIWRAQNFIGAWYSFILSGHMRIFGRKNRLIKSFVSWIRKNEWSSWVLCVESVPHHLPEDILLDPLNGWLDYSLMCKAINGCRETRKPSIDAGREWRNFPLVGFFFFSARACNAINITVASTECFHLWKYFWYWHFHCLE